MTSELKNKKDGYGKHILLAGTHEKSIGRFVAEALHKDGWTIWLYSRHAKHVDKEGWHERACDISKEKEVRALLKEIPQVNACIFTADSGGHGTLSELEEAQLKSLLNAKILGSFLLTKILKEKAKEQGEKIKLGWVAGGYARKPEWLMAYSIINAGLFNYVGAIQEHYGTYFDAYYLSTPLISPSPLGDEYIKDVAKRTKNTAEYKAYPPQVVLDSIEKVLYEDVMPGIDIVTTVDAV